MESHLTGTVFVHVFKFLQFCLWFKHSPLGHKKLFPHSGGFGQSFKFFWHVPSKHKKGFNEVHVTIVLHSYILEAHVPSGHGIVFSEHS